MTHVHDLATLDGTLPPASPGQSQLYDLLIRDTPQLDQVIMDADEHIGTLQKLLGVSVLGTVLYGTTVGFVAQKLAISGPLGTWLGSMPLLTLPLTLSAAFLTALMVCLPSFYFYTQLAGMDASFRLIVAQALRVQARTSVLLLGILPVYAALSLAAVLGVLQNGEALIACGLLLPFLLGLVGLVSLYKSFHRLSALLPVAHVRRPLFVLGTVVAWGAVYTAVCPVALYRIGVALAIAGG